MQIAIQRFPDWREERSESVEPKKFIFAFGPAGFDFVSVIEMSPILYGGPAYYEFISQERFRKVIDFHSDLGNHSPIFSQSWLAAGLDLWEDVSDWIIYNSETECASAAAKFQEECERERGEPVPLW